MTEVILVDEEDQQIGVMEKIEAHEKGLLHRAFSVFIMNKNGQMLLQQRALSKYHSPGLWTNACCSHPSPGEYTLTAANRRLKEEMGFSCPLTKIGMFTYKTEFDNGLTEHEFDHLLLGLYDGEVQPDKTEVEDYKWLNMDEIDDALIKGNAHFSSWFKLAFPMVKGWLGLKSEENLL
ncbi:MAG: isopentenyl-diphosphate Delta-isomerase [Pyrinomonadaceae bacterium]|nr:isopentenyl-diphosphate Delta-isomerase [Sphingobacteriaceae bacterium]